MFKYKLKLVLIGTDIRQGKCCDLMTDVTTLQVNREAIRESDKNKIHWSLWSYRGRTGIYVHVTM